MTTTLKGTTPVPNVLFDVHLKKLKPAELKLLLVVIRQTWGWRDKKTKERKYRDWLSGSQLREKTGCSRRAITNATEALINQGLIEATDESGMTLNSPDKRRGQTKLYYRFCCEKAAQRCAGSSTDPKQILHITKDTPDKKVIPENQDKRKRFTQADIELFSRELKKAGNIESLLLEKAVIKFRDGQRVIIYCDQTALYKERFFSGYELPGVSDKGLRVPYSVWMELYHHYQRSKSTGL